MCRGRAGDGLRERHPQRYDLLWHSNGALYGPANGSAAGGARPATPAPLPASSARRIDHAIHGNYTGPAFPASVLVTEPSTTTSSASSNVGYYGHPNPSRCEWVLNGGNPTAERDVAEVLAREGVFEHLLEAAAGLGEPVIPGPDRARLLELVS